MSKVRVLPCAPIFKKDLTNTTSVVSLDMNDYEEDTERCEHGLLWEFECEMCEKSNREFFAELFIKLGAGDAELGKQIMLEMMNKKRTL